MRVRWETVVGRRYEGELLKVENDGDGLMADIRLADGTIKCVEVECLEEVAQ